MDFLNILESVNKVSIFFFIVTLGVMGYEFYLFRKERRKAQKPKIPTFSPAKTAAPGDLAATVPVIQDKKTTIKKHKNLVVIIASVALAFLGAVAFIAIRQYTAQQEPVPPVRTQAHSSPTKSPSPIQKTQPLFITPTVSPTLTPTPEVSPSVSPTSTILALSTGTPAPTAEPTTTATTEALLITATPTPGGATTTATPASGTLTPSPTTGSLPSAGVAQPQLFIFLLGAFTVLFSILY